jgi:inward rectifier potassium channel
MAKTKDPGLGSKYENEVKRMINEDGSYNIIRYGSFSGVRDFYKFLIDISWKRFFLYSLLGYLSINAIFASIYLGVGLDQISGLKPETANFFDAYFFSAQTLTSVGYGRLAPIGFGSNIVATLESFIGLISIALITGLLYGRFSKPSSKLKFSKNILISPFEDGKAVMFKMVNQRNSILLNTDVKTLLIMDQGTEKGQFNKTYHNLELQINHVDFFPLTWTIVHKIDENSPFHGMDLQEIKLRNAEVITLVEAFDETHSQMVTERKSFGCDQWLDGVKFSKNFKTNTSGKIELYIDDLDTLIKVEE